MNTNRIIYTLVLLFTTFLTFAQSKSTTKNSVVLFETTEGNIKIKLYDETPLHKENFLKLVKEGYYDGILFHRVIKNFMVQAGDPNSKNAKPNEFLGSGGPKYTIPAEFNDNLYHLKGAVAAARQPDNTNPLKASSGSQFYIVQGQTFTNQQLDAMEVRNLHKRFTDEQRSLYTTIGGTPHLDYNYTVFGEVVEGMEIIDRISTFETDTRDRPLKDVKIIKAKILY